MRRREAGNGNAIRRARHVVEPQVMAERDRARLAAVLAADADFERRPHAPTLADAVADQAANAVLVEHLERIVEEDAAVEVRRQKPSGVVATHP